MLNIKTAVGIMTGLTLKEQLLTYMKKYCSISASIEQDLKNNITPRSVYVNLAKSISEIDKYDLEDAFNIVWFAKFKDSELVKKAEENGISTEDYYEVCKEMTLLESDSGIASSEFQRKKEEITHKGFRKALFALPAEEEVYFDVLVLEELEYTMRVYEKILGRDLTDLDVKNLNETLKNMVSKYKTEHEHEHGNLKPKEARALSAFGREPSVDASSLREAWTSRSRTSTVDNRPERSQALNPLGSPPAAEPLTFIKKQKTANASVKEKEPVPEPVPVKEELPSWDSVNAQGLHKELKNILGGTQRRQQQAAQSGSSAAPEASAHGESSGVYTGEEQEQTKVSVFQQIPPENTISSGANAGAAGAAGAGGGNWWIAFLIVLGLGASSAVYYLWPRGHKGRGSRVLK